MTRTDAASLLDVAERGLDGDRRILAAGPEISRALAKVLLRKGDQDTMYALASNPATPPSTLRKLSSAVRRGKFGGVFGRPVPRAELARRLAANPSLPGSELSQRLRNPRWDVRAAALLNPSVAASTVRNRIAADVWGVGAIVAAATTDDALLTMLVPSSERIRLAMATNPHASVTILEALLGYDEPYVAAVIARHPRMTYAVARRIIADGAPAWILRALAENPAISGAHRDRFDEQAEGAPGRSDFDPLTCAVTPDRDVSSIADWYEFAAKQDGAQWSPLWRVRALVAARQTTAAGVDRFVIDPHPKVRLAALEAPLSLPQIEDLIDDADAEVGVRAVAVHDALPDERRETPSYTRRPRKDRRMRTG